MDPVRVYVGTDRSQLLAVKVLEHSIKRHTQLPVEVYPMLDLPIRKTKDPRQRQRTGFSFSRFCIPNLCNYNGRAIYMDADMLVFKDIAELWNWPFENHTILLQRTLNNEQAKKNKHGAPPRRIRQCAVMLIDCQNNTWKIDDIIDSLDTKKYTYEDLMYDLCIIDDDKVGEVLPFEWNSLEHYDQGTRLIHYTDMNTQPWTSTMNPWAEKWFEEVRLMLSNGSLTWAELKGEIKLGYFRPSLVLDLNFGHLVPKFLESAFNFSQKLWDKFLGFKPHKEVYAAKALRDKLIKEYEHSLKQAPSHPN